MTVWKVLLWWLRDDNLGHSLRLICHEKLFYCFLLMFVAFVGRWRQLTSLDYDFLSRNCSFRFFWRNEPKPVTRHDITWRTQWRSFVSQWLAKHCLFVWTTGVRKSCAFCHFRDFLWLKVLINMLVDFYTLLDMAAYIQIIHLLCASQSFF